MNEMLKTQLLGLGLKEDQIEKLATQGVSEASDMQMLSAEEIVAHTSCGLITAKKVVAAFVEKVEAVTPVMNMGDSNILPSVPTDDAWLNALRTGGILKVEESSVISAVRAALAEKVGLYTVLDKLVKKMEEFADANAESVSVEFFKIRKQITKRTYAEIFEAIDGLDGNFVTDARKKSFLSKVDGALWPAISSFYLQLKGWVDAWQQGAASPTMLMNAIASLAGGGGKMPPGMMAPPESGSLRDEADALNDTINKVFAGVGVQISAALAYDASRIKDVLVNEKLPALIGTANREQMLRTLGVDVPATYPRLETNVTKFVLGAIKIKDVAAGNDELEYFGQLYMLGSQIPWDKLGAGGGSGLARKL